MLVKLFNTIFMEIHKDDGQTKANPIFFLSECHPIEKIPYPK
jgi:hypothetical protein